MFFAKSPQDLLTPEQILSMSGLAFMQGILDGTLPAPPIARLMNYRLTAVAKGQVSFEGTPQFDHLNPASGVHGGWYGTILDSCMACAVMSMVPRGAVYTTLEYKVNLTRAIPLDTPVRATGTTDHAGRTTAVAHGEIRDIATGKLYATGSTTCLIMSAAPAPSR